MTLKKKIVRERESTPTRLVRTTLGGMAEATEPFPCGWSGGSAPPFNPVHGERLLDQSLCTEGKRGRLQEERRGQVWSLFRTLKLGEYGVAAGCPADGERRGTALMYLFFFFKFIF